MELSELTGKLVSARVVENEDEVTFISANGIILRTSVALISRQGRRTRGVTVMDLKEGDAIASVAIVRQGRLSMVGGDELEQASEELEEELAVQSPASGENGRAASQVN
jgi:DNA gyrase subunit A